MPKARQAIVDAARHIVREHGAGKLTYEELVQQSGITRGGITYHFPTKEALLRALVEADIEQWCELEEQLKPEIRNATTAELIAYMRGHTERNDDRRRFVTGMLSAVTLDHSLLDPVRAFMKGRRAGLQWDDAQLRQHLLRMAAQGLFWSEVFGCEELPADVRKRFVAFMEQLAKEWTASAGETDAA